VDGDEIREYLGMDMVRQFWLSTKSSNYPCLEYGQGCVTNAASYNNLKEYLYLKDTFGNFKKILMALKPLHDEGNLVVWITLEGFFWFSRTLFGIENHMYAFYDEPELIQIINNDLADFSIYLIEEFCKILKPDFMTFAEYMSYNLGLVKDCGKGIANIKDQVQILYELRVTLMMMLFATYRKNI